MGIGTSDEIAAAGMSAQRLRLEIIAANLANARTTRTAEGGPYRRKFPVFRAVNLEAGARSFAGELRSVAVDDIRADDSELQRLYQPGHPDADEYGYVSYPNINIIDEMVNLAGAARSYEANLQVLKTVGRLSNAALDISR